MITDPNQRAFSNKQYTRVSFLPNGATPYHPPIASTPIFITLDGILPEGKRFSHPLVVQIEDEDGEILVSEPRFYIHASAFTIQDAVVEFKRVLVDELEALTSDEEKLSSRLRAQLHYLRTIIGAA
jgi:hypothetical protein